MAEDTSGFWFFVFAIVSGLKKLEVANILLL